MILTILLVTSQLSLVAGAWDVRHCPKLCRCSQKLSRRLHLKLRTVECSNRKLQTIPSTTPPETEALILKGNKIKHVTDLIRLPKLVELDLSYNYIESLGHRPIFQNHTRLKYADFSHNQINVLLHGTFSGAQELLYLYLGNNRIQKPELHSFAGIGRLQNLTLSSNKIKKLDRDWFSSMRVLQNLDMSRNEIQVIETATLRDLLKLRRLNLERNNISVIEHGAFRTLINLDFLSLGENNLTEVPIGSFTTFANLKFLIMDKNPIRFIIAGSFEFINVREISLRRMPVLEMVDSHGFTNLPFLYIMHMYDNPKLVYIDGSAFARVDRLKKLYLHNNALVTIPHRLYDNLPGLTEISFYHNPVKCDCNARWIRERMLLDARKEAPLFTHPGEIACAWPAKLNRMVLNILPVEVLPDKCAPTLMPFFQDSYQEALGGSVSLNCRAIGVPEPRLSWIIANGQVVNASSNYARLKFMLGNLTIYYLRGTDGGKYTCIAQNSEGYDSKSTVLQIHSTTMNIIPIGIASNYITVTWNSTGNTLSRSKYLLMYKNVNSKDKFKGIHLRVYMRTYTIMNLRPKTTYKFCIAYEHMEDVAYLNCQNITTRETDYSMRGITHYSSVAIVIGLITTVAVVMFLCLAFTAVKNYRRRKPYKEPETRLTNPKVDNMSQIPLDNIYNPPSTPIYSSTASLIPHSSQT